LIAVIVAVAKFGISATFNMCYMSSILLLPTILVSGAFGFCNAVAQFVTIPAPLIADLPMPTPLYINLAFISITTVSASFLIEKLPKFI
jgi:hypothetical protein